MAMNYVAAFDGLKFSTSTLQYALFLCELTGHSLTGLFLEDISYKSYPIEKILATESQPEKILAELEEKDTKKRAAAVQRFQSAASKRGVDYSTIKSENIAIQEIRNHSMFADLMILDKKESFTRLEQKVPTRFIKDVISTIHCPVVIVPQTFRPIDKVVFLYDGSPAAMHAIKMYASVFDKTDFPLEVIYVSRDGKSALPANKALRKYLKTRFDKVQYTILQGNPEEEICGYLKNNLENELVVLGAYKRSEVSRWFKTSMADVLMKDTNSPLFIANSI